jgi:hypothetical protein
MATREERMAENESIFREVNERVAEVSERFKLEQVSAVCECANTGCLERFELSRSDYEGIRSSSSSRFAVIPGHEKPEVETVIDRREGYLIVQKIGVGAEIAEREDARNEPARRED